MSTKVFLFGAWCLTLVGGTIASSYYAWSPFADGKRDNRPGFYGPTHK